MTKRPITPVYHVDPTDPYRAFWIWEADSEALRKEDPDWCEMTDTWILRYRNRPMFTLESLLRRLTNRQFDTMRTIARGEQTDAHGHTLNALVRNGLLEPYDDDNVNPTLLGKVVIAMILRQPLDELLAEMRFYAEERT